MLPLTDAWFRRYLPPTAAEEEPGAVRLAFTAAVLTAGASFAIRYGAAYRALFYRLGGQLLPVPGARIAPFLPMTGPTAAAFAALTALCLLLAAVHEASYRRGSRSVYLLRRLPDGGATARRFTWALPLRLAALSLLTWAALLGCWYLVWRFVTPPACL